MLQHACLYIVLLHAGHALMLILRSGTRVCMVISALSQTRSRENAARTKTMKQRGGREGRKDRQGHNNFQASGEDQLA